MAEKKDDEPDDGKDKESKKSGLSPLEKAAIIGGVSLAAGILAVVAAPVVVAGLGFTAAGATAGTASASLMSAAAIANGGGVAAGSVVATLQSIGAAGLSSTMAAAIGGTAATATAATGATAAVIHDKVTSKSSTNQSTSSTAPNPEPEVPVSPNASASSSSHSLPSPDLPRSEPPKPLVALVSSSSVDPPPRRSPLIRLRGAPCAQIQLVHGAAPLILRRTDQRITASEIALELGAVLLEVPQDIIRNAMGNVGDGLFRLVFRSAQDRLQFLSGQSWLTQTADGFTTTSLSDGKGFVSTAGIERVNAAGVPLELNLACAALAALGRGCAAFQRRQMHKLIKQSMDFQELQVAIELKSLSESCHSQAVEILELLDVLDADEPLLVHTSLAPKLAHLGADVEKLAKMSKNYLEQHAATHGSQQSPNDLARWMQLYRTFFSIHVEATKLQILKHSLEAYLHQLTKNWKARSLYERKMLETVNQLPNIANQLNDIEIKLLEQSQQIDNGLLSSLNRRIDSSQHAAPMVTVEFTPWRREQQKTIDRYYLDYVADDDNSALSLEDTEVARSGIYLSIEDNNRNARFVYLE